MSRECGTKGTYARDLSIDGLMEDKPQLHWASHDLCALASASPFP